MFVSKLQFLVQLKFLGVATINMLANVFRLVVKSNNKFIKWKAVHKSVQIKINTSYEKYEFQRVPL